MLEEEFMCTLHCP